MPQTSILRREVVIDENKRKLFSRWGIKGQDNAP
jgi:hypothetical protein